MTDKFMDAVRAGQVPGLSVDPNNPATSYDAMPIDSPSGTRVRFTGYGGYDIDQAHAREYLVINGVYTVDRTEIGGWSTSVFLREVPGREFNSVMFEAAPHEQHKKGAD